MKALSRWWKAHGTKLLGAAATIVAGALVTPDLVPVKYVPYLHFANLLLGAVTVKRGFTNSKNQDPTGGVK